MMNKTTFASILKKNIESYGLNLPVYDPILLRLQVELVKKEPNLHAIEKFIHSDQALSINLLKIVNSVRYRGLVEITTVKSAIMRLGISEIARIVSTEINKKMFTSPDSQIDAIMKKLWQHSLGCAFVTAWLSNRLDFGVLQNEAFFAGLFHDIGKLLILKVIAEKKLKDKSIIFPQELLLGAMDILHAEQGYQLMKQINLPINLAIIARDHHLQELDRDSYMLILVRMANHICHYMGIGLIIQDPFLDLLETEEADFLKITKADLEEIIKFLETTPCLST